MRYTLEEVLERARAMSPLARIGQARVDEAAWRALEARYERFPRFRAQLGAAPTPRVELEYSEELGALDPLSNRQSDRDLLQSMLGGAGIGIQAEVELGVPITTFGKIRLARQIAQIGVDTSTILRDAAAAETVFQAYRAYLTVQWYVDVDVLLREVARRLDEAEERLEEELEDGDRTARTSLRQLAIGRTQFVELRGAADGLGRLARRALAQTLELPPDFSVTPFDDAAPEGDFPGLEDALEYGRQHRPDAVLLDQAVNAAELNARIHRRSMTPDFIFAARVGGAYSPTVDDVSGPFIHDPYNRFGFGFAVSLRWAMNPAQSVARARRAQVGVTAVEAQRDAAWLGIELEIAEAYFDAEARRDTAISYAAARRAANAWLSQVTFQYDQGLADFSDLKEPLEAYYRTAGSHLEAMLRYRIAVANLAVKVGAMDLDRWPSIE